MKTTCAILTINTHELGEVAYKGKSFGFFFDAIVHGKSRAEVIKKTEKLLDNILLVYADESGVSSIDELYIYIQELREELKDENLNHFARGVTYTLDFNFSNQRIHSVVIP